MIWKRSATVEQLEETNKGTLAEALNIHYTEVGADFLEATMPVDGRTKQPAGLLHGGASAALAETLGSIAGHLCIDTDKRAVGIELNISHLKSATKGHVVGRAMPIRLGRTVQVWEIRIRNEAGETVAVSRLTLAVQNNSRDAEKKLSS